MRIIVPFTELHGETLDALRRYCPYDVEYFDVSHATDAYFNVIKDVWSDAESFVIIEHDVEIGKDTLESLVTCEHTWCAFSYAMGPAGYQTALGCTKFDAALMTAHPTLMNEVGDVIDPWCPPRDWRRLDTRLKETLTQRYNYVEHCHTPPVKHHNSSKRVPIEVELEL